MLKTPAAGRESPSWLDSLMFVALMSGPPKFRTRDSAASLAGAFDTVVLVQLAGWACAALWVVARLYPQLVRRGTVPTLSTPQIVGALFIASLSLSLRQSPGFLLTAFMLGQFTVMLAFAWVFAHRFGASTYLRHLFAGVGVLAVLLIGTAYLTPDVVIDIKEGRFRGERIASTGAVGLMGLVFCFSNVPRLRSLTAWGLIPLFGVLLVTSRMRTAYVGMLAYVAVAYVFGRGLRIRKAVPVLVAIFIGLFALDAATRTREYLVRDTPSIETLSDRIPLWAHLTRVVMREEPVIGLGYYAASRVLAPQYNRGLGTAHSVFFEVLVGGGLIAATLYLVLCASLLLQAGRLLATARGQPEIVAAAGLLAVVLVLALVSTEAMHAGPEGFTFWSMTALLPRLQREVASRTEVRARPLARRVPLAAGVATRQPVRIS